MSNAVIGALRVLLSADTAQFSSDLGRAQKSLAAFGRGARQIGNDLSKFGSALTIGVTAPVIAMAVASVKAATETQQALAQVEAAQASMGHTVGLTTAQLQRQAKVLQDTSNFDDDEILRGVTSTLLRFGNIQGAIFQRAQQAVVNFSAATGTDLQTAALKIGRALDNPIKGMTTLGRIGISFTTEQQKMGAALVRAGKPLEAQGAILEKFEQKYANAAKAQRAATPGQDAIQAWRDIQETIGFIVIKVLPALASKLTEVLNAFQALSPSTQENIVKFAGLAAVVGPLVLALGTLFRGYVVLTAALAAGATIVRGVSAGLAGMMATQYAVAASARVLTAAEIGMAAAGLQAGASVSVLRGALLTLSALTIVGVVLALAAALGYFIIKALGATQAQKDFNQAAGAADKALSAYEQAALSAAGKTGNARKAALDHAAALRTEALEAIKTAKALYAKADAEAAAAQERRLASDKAFTDYQPNNVGGGAQGGLALLAMFNQKVAEQRKKAADAAKSRLGDQLAQLANIEAEVNAKPSATLDFDKGNTPADHAGKALEAARKTFAKGIQSLQDTVNRGLDDIALPQATASANALREKLDELSATAKDAGVNTGAFAGTINGLRDRIDQLEIAGLAEEARKFAAQVADDGRAVDTFAKGGLSPLDEALQGVDNTYKNLREQIEEHIRANQVLAEKNGDAGASMADLRAKLVLLDKAHAQATASAKAQFEAEERLANLHNQAEVNSISDAMTHMQQLRGDMGALSDSQQKMLDIERDLRDTRLEAETKLAELVKARDAAEAVHNTAEATRLNVLIGLQSKLYGLVQNTTAQQIAAHERLLELLAAVRSQVSSSISDLLGAAEKGFKDFDFKAWLSTLAGGIQKAINDSLAQSLTDKLMDWLGLGKSQTVGTMYVGNLVTGAGAGGKAGGILGFIKNIFGGGGGDGGFNLPFGSGTDGSSLNTGLDLSGASDFIPSLPGFATGGGFRIGGSGGIDSQLVQFRGTPGEIVDVHHGQGGGRGAVSAPVTFKVDARGSTPDAVALLNKKLEDLAGALPQIIVANVRNASARGMLRAS